MQGVSSQLDNGKSHTNAWYEMLFNAVLTTENTIKLVEESDNFLKLLVA